MRSIGKKNKNKVIKIIQEELNRKKSYEGLGDVEEKVLNRIPDEIYDTWEGAYMEIKRIIMDEVLKHKIER